MAQFSATWNVTEANDLEAGDHPTVEVWELFGENIEYLGQIHNHGGDNPDGTRPAAGHGGQLALKSPIMILYFLGSVS